MKANELRIANYHYWIEIKEQNICEVSLQDFADINENENVLIDYFPIPITEDWLLRLGFEKHKDEGIKSYHIIINDITFSYSLHEIAMNRLSVKTDRETSDWIHIDNVIHVHRLQNIVFSITETEL